MKKQLILLSLFAFVFTISLHAAPAIERKIDWSTFLERHDMTWKQLPKNWYDSPFLGNGMMGVQLRKKDAHTLRMDIGRGDVQSHGKLRVRLPIGQMELKSKTTLKSCDWRLHLHNALLTGTMDAGAKLRCFVDSNHDLILFELKDGKKNYSFQWHPDKPINPRWTMKELPKNFVEPSPPNLFKKGKIHFCVQRLDKGELLVKNTDKQWVTVTAWMITERAGTRELRLTVKHGNDEAQTIAQAQQLLEGVQKKSFDALLKEHQRWWHNYYPESFLALSDPFWEGFYWIQMYKLASATRSDRMLIDNQGPWLQATPWPKIWWNLNAQLTYWPVYTANRLALGESLVGPLEKNITQLIANVPEKYRGDSAGLGHSGMPQMQSGVGVPGRGNEVGNLLWAMHNYWMHCEYAGDDQRLREKFYPMLQRSVNYYLHFLTKDADGKLHIPKTASPEYNFAKGPDTNYDLALLKWGLTTLIQTANEQKIA